MEPLTNYRKPFKGGCYGYKPTSLFIYTAELLYSAHPWDKYKSPDYRGFLISGVNLYYSLGHL